MTKSDAALIIEDLMERANLFDEQEQALDMAIETLNSFDAEVKKLKQALAECAGY